MTSPSAFPPDGSPRIHAYLQADGTGAITVDGTTSILNEPGADAARHAIVNVAIETARRQGGPVRVASTDPDGQWLLLVGPDGSVQHERVTTDPSPAPVTAAEPAPADPAQPGDHEDHDDAGESGDWPDPGTGFDHQGGDSWPGSPTTPQPESAASASEPVDDPVPARAWQEEPAAARRADPSPPNLPDSPATFAVAPEPAAPAASQPTPPRSAASAAEPGRRSWPAPAPARPTAPTGPPAPTGPAAPTAPSWPPQAAAPPAPAAPLPTLNDLLDSRPAPPAGPAEWGWQGVIRRMTFGAIKPRPGPAELRHRTDVAAVQRSLAGPRTIVVVNPKGGAHKTTATMLIAATFGLHRGGYTLAWDNNETRGTLGWRAVPARHTNTAVNLLADLERFDDPTRARIGDLDNYVRSQGSAQFDVLASDEDARASASIDAGAFRRLHAALSRFYRIMVIDTGNNMRASNWGAALDAADQLVIVSTVREDTAASAAWLVDGLRSRLFEEKVANAVMLLSAPGLQPDPALRSRLHSHFGQLTRAVIDVPYDPALVDGAAIDVERLQSGTREAWLHATAVIAEGL